MGGQAHTHPPLTCIRWVLLRNMAIDGAARDASSVLCHGRFDGPDVLDVAAVLTMHLAGSRRILWEDIQSMGTNFFFFLIRPHMSCPLSR